MTRLQAVPCGSYRRWPVRDWLGASLLLAGIGAGLALMLVGFLVVVGWR